MVQRRNSKMSRQRILVPVDFGTLSDAALIYAGQLAIGMNDMVSCIHIIEDGGGIETGETRRKQRREAEQRLSEKVNSILSQGKSIEFEIMVSSGDVCQKILEKARDLHVRFIMMGMSYPNRDRNASGGTKAEQILEKSLVPVIFFNGSAAERIVREDSKFMKEANPLARFMYGDQLNDKLKEVEE